MVRSISSASSNSARAAAKALSETPPPTPVTIELDGGRIRAVRSVLNPAKLERALRPTIQIE